MVARSCQIWGFPQMGVPNSWMVYLRENPSINGWWLGVSPWRAGNPHETDNGGEVWVLESLRTRSVVEKNRHTRPGKHTKKKAIEHGHRNSWFPHEKWWFSIVMLILPGGTTWKPKEPWTRGFNLAPASLWYPVPILLVSSPCLTFRILLEVSHATTKQGNQILWQYNEFYWGIYFGLHVACGLQG